jgi:hypothetical protein
MADVDLASGSSPGESRRLCSIRCSLPPTLPQALRHKIVGARIFSDCHGNMEPLEDGLNRRPPRNG